MLEQSYPTKDDDADELMKTGFNDYIKEYYVHGCQECLVCYSYYTIIQQVNAVIGINNLSDDLEILCTCLALLLNKPC